MIVLPVLLGEIADNRLCPLPCVGVVRKAAYRLFHELLALVDKQVVHAIFRVHIAKQVAEQEANAPIGMKGVRLQGPAKTMGENAGTHTSTDPKYKDVGRNDPCPCGSGKKYKKCHGA